MRLAIIASILAMVAFGSLAAVASADGNGSPDSCEGGLTVNGDPEASYTAPDGLVVDGVCIKSGANMFDGNKHSDVLDDGIYEDGCYEVDGVGTQTVTVTRLLDGNACQGISHIDVITATCSVDCEPPPGCQEPPCDPVDPCEEEPELCEPVLDCDDPEYAAENPEECGEVQLCIDGDFITVPSSEGLSDTGDCDPVRLCVDGESMTVTRFDAENDPDLEDADPGSCTPTEEPPPDEEEPPVEEEPEPVEEVAGIQEEAVVEEVAALPSAGYGRSTDDSLTWTLVVIAALGGLGGASAVLGRRTNRA